jgi:hypothetical protein
MGMSWHMAVFPAALSAGFFAPSDLKADRKLWQSSFSQAYGFSPVLPGLI